MAATDLLVDYVKRHSTIQSNDGNYLDGELDKVSDSISYINQAFKTFAGAGGVPLTSLATIATGRFLGNISGSTASPVALTATQVTAQLDVFTTTLKGLVPSPGSAAGKFLKDDATWATAITSLAGYMQGANNLSDVANAATARANLGVYDIPAGTLMLFQQTSAPTGWTKQTTHNDKALRVVSGTASSGGTNAFSTVFAQTDTGGTALSVANIPSGTFLNTSTSISTGTGTVDQNSPIATFVNSVTLTQSTSGGGTAHTHAMDIRVQYVDLIIASKN